ncbi:hypothetical protein OSTOST_11142 [Ostertagia ostertagi]
MDTKYFALSNDRDRAYGSLQYGSWNSGRRVAAAAMGRESLGTSEAQKTMILRFLAEFTELFDIAPDKTRVSVVQYSDQIRHEFGLDDYKDSRSLHEAIKNIE